MSDFTYTAMQQCKKLRTSTMKVGDYLVTGIFSGNPRCTCPAFKFSKNKPKNCKHIDQAEKESYCWHQMTGEPQTEEQKNNMICPVCGGETEWVQVAG